MNSQFAVVDSWDEVFEEDSFRNWAVNLRARLRAPSVNLGLIFISPGLFSEAEQILELVRVHAQVPLLVGCSSNGFICNDSELEENRGLVLGLFHLPGAELKPFYFTQIQVEQATGPEYWAQQTGVKPGQTNGWLVFADPFHLNSELWLAQWNEAFAPAPIVGGLASGDYSEQRTQIYLNGEVHEQGGVALSVGGEVGLTSLISQGCTPIGETWTITKANENIIHEIGNRPAYQVLLETVQGLPAAEQEKTRGNLFIGLVVNEYLDDFHRGDFLIRNMLGIDPNSGAIAIGAYPRAGQTVQFQRRDAAAASEDLLELLGRMRDRTKEATVYGGCLCNCNGRGSNLFNEPDHDARMIQQRLGPFALAGFFCNGEIGPVGQRNFLHGYTASLSLFVKQPNQ